MTRAGKTVKGRPKRNSPWPPCKAEGCDKSTKGGSLGFCHTHYVAARRGALDPETGSRVRDPLRVSSYGTGARCRVEGCLRRPKGKGLCSAHWQRQKNGLPIDSPIRPRSVGKFVECLLVDCSRRANSRGMCQKHAEQRRRGILNSEGVMLRKPRKGGRPR